MVSSNTSFERQPPHKTTLYCPDCDHASRINGDWIIEVHTEHLDYECPECGTTVGSNHDRPVLTTRSGGVLQFESAD